MIAAQTNKTLPSLHPELDQFKTIGHAWSSACPYCNPRCPHGYPVRPDVTPKVPYHPQTPTPTFPQVPYPGTWKYTDGRGQTVSPPPVPPNITVMDC